MTVDFTCCFKKRDDWSQSYSWRILDKNGDTVSSGTAASRSGALWRLYDAERQARSLALAKANGETEKEKTNG